jgi:hypothetical protein
MSLDHDLGGDDTSVRFLRMWIVQLWDGVSNPPEYQVHSANPVGRDNLISLLESWRKTVGGES